jgi:ABC-2 type transport system permease protein
VTASFGVQLGRVARRSILRTFRQPLVWGPMLVFPLFFFAITAPGLEGATAIKGFPTDSYVSFALAMPFVQAGLSGVQTAGGELAEDIRTGFLSRLSLTPLNGAALVLGNLAGTVVLAFVGGLLYLAVGLAAGAEIEAGAGGAVVLVLLSVLIAFGFGALGIFVALRTGNADSVQALFPLLFALFFLSSMAMPRDLITTDWFKTVATINPLSYLVEAVRSLLISGWDGEALALGCGIAVAMAVIGLALASTQVHQRLART